LAAWITADRVETLAVSAAETAVRDEAVERLRATVDRLIAHIHGMADPAAPFSSMVATWIAAFITSV